jgi:predicted membrane metal-binding protein
VLVGGILFILPAAIEAVFLPSLRQGIPNPIPDYEATLLEVAFFFHRFRWFLAPTTIFALFLIATVTRKSGIRS